MSLYKLGDVVSLSRAQTNLITVLEAPSSEGERYSIHLEINGQLTEFFVLASLGDNVEQVAIALVDELVQSQTVYDVTAEFASNGEIGVAGELGIPFQCLVGPKMENVVVEPAVSAKGSDGLQIGPLRVLKAESAVGTPPREFYVKDPDGTIRYVNVLTVRELDSSLQFEVEASKILTVISS